VGYTKQQFRRISFQATNTPFTKHCQKVHGEIKQSWKQYILQCTPCYGRSQWPSGLRRGFTAARLLRLRFRIPLGAWMSLSCECCVFSDRGLCDGPIANPKESYQLWWVIVCDLETSRTKRPWPALGCCAKKHLVMISGYAGSKRKIRIVVVLETQSQGSKNSENLQARRDARSSKLTRITLNCFLINILQFSTNVLVSLKYSIVHTLIQICKQ
jgi:hypothetical protein